MESKPKPIFQVNLSARGPVSQLVASLAGEALGSLLALNRLDEIYFKVQGPGGVRPFLERVLAAFRMTCRLDPADLERVPRQGPAVVVANHPFGGLEGIILGHVLLGVRPDVKIMANHLLARIPELRELFIFVDPFETRAAIQANLKPLKEALAWVGQGGLLVIFPAGEVAHLDLRRRAVVDPEWNRAASRIVLRTKATVVPAYFGGDNGHLFQMAGFLHPRLRTALLPRALLNKTDKTVSLRLGGPLAFDGLGRVEDPAALTAYLRWRTYALARAKAEPGQASAAARPAEPLISPVAQDRLAADVAALPAEATLVKSGRFRVFLAAWSQLPNLMGEIGRLREVTFRQVGEGTGKAVDLDRFDDYYLHLCLFNEAEAELVGAYRLGRADEILDQRGVEGLYTSTLFKFKPDFFRRLPAALELGRSFIRAEYQRSYSSLLLLWKGIGQFIVRHPRYRYLFGPVSVSAAYSSLSRQLLVDFVQTHHVSDLAGLIKPRHRARLKPARRLDHRPFIQTMPDLEWLSGLIADIEGQGTGVPVLLRQYLKLSAKAVGWNRDPDFGQVLDCLMVVDLLKTDPKTMVHYLGQAEYQAFLEFHRRRASSVSRAA
jgi:putative hemolysin